MNTNIYIIYTKLCFNIKKLKIIKPYSIENKKIINILYDKQSLLIQTPLCTLPYRYMLYDNKYFQIDLFFTLQEFKDIIDKIIEPIHDKIKKNFASLIENKNYIEPIMTVNNTFKLRAKNINIEAITVYNYHKNKIDIRNIERNDQIKAIIQLERIIIDIDSYYFTFKIIQIKKNCSIDFFSPTINCLIKDDEISIEKFEKFTKMLKIGVPIHGVTQKMQLEGFIETDIQYFSQLHNKSKINCFLPGPPPHPTSFMSAINKNKEPLAFLADIKNGPFALKKAIITDKNDNIKNKILKYVDKSKHDPPSLQDILHTRTNLRSMKHSY
jgi:hypothetical protein